jgi:hypothetical protein
MDSRSLAYVFAVGGVSFFYFAWRFWSLRRATPRPGTKFAALSADERRERLRSVATTSGLVGAAMLGCAAWLWLRNGG